MKKYARMMALVAMTMGCAWLVHCKKSGGVIVVQGKQTVPSVGMALGEPVASVNGFPIGADALRLAFRQSSARAGASSSITPRLVLEDMIELELLAQEAKRQGIDLELESKAILAKKLIAKRPRALVTEAETRAAYEEEKRKASEKKASAYQAERLSLVVATETNKELVEAFGKEFREPAAKASPSTSASSAPSTRTVRTIGPVTADDLSLPPEVKSAALALKQPNDTTNTILANGTYYWAKLVSRTAATSFEQLKSGLERMIERQKSQKELKAYIQELKTKAAVRIDEQAFNKMASTIGPKGPSLHMPSQPVPR